MNMKFLDVLLPMMFDGLKLTILIAVVGIGIIPDRKPLRIFITAFLPSLLLSHYFLNYVFLLFTPGHHSNAQHTYTYNCFPIHTKSLSCIPYSGHVPYSQVLFS